MAKEALVLLSGGLDSTVALWWARRQPYAKISAISFSYGAREEPASLECSRSISARGGIEHAVLQVDVLKEISRDASALVDASGAPGRHDDPDLRTTRAVWVPARNLVLVSLAAAIAETLQGDVDIIVGFDEEEARTFPDNSLRFVRNLNLTLMDAVLEKRVRVVAPLIRMSKSDIVTLGAELEAPVELSCSCYRPTREEGGGPVHCGRCQSCILRHNGFSKAGLRDPTIYQVEPS